MGLFDALPAGAPQSLDPNNPATVLSPDAVKRRQLLADALMKQGGDTSPIRSPWQAAARMAQGLLGGWDAGRADSAEAAGAAQAAKTQAAVLASALGNDNAPSAPAPGAAAGAAPDDSAAPAAPDSTAPPSGALGDAAAYIRMSAAKNGIDPDVALRVAQSEGLNSYTGDGGSSFGPFQLHYGNVASGGNAVGGLGDEFTKATGLDARDPSTVKAQIDFALAHAAQNGWGAWHGAQKIGLGNFDGIGTSPSSPPAGSPPQLADAGAAVPLPPAKPAEFGGIAQGDGDTEETPANPAAPGAGLNIPAGAGAGVPVSGGYLAAPGGPPAVAPAAAPATPAPSAPALAAALRKPQDQKQIAALAGAMSDPWADAGTKQLAATLLAAKLKTATTGAIVKDPTTGQFGQYDSTGKFTTIANADKETATAAQKDYEYSGTHPGFVQYQQSHGPEASKAHVVQGALVDNQGKVLYQSPASLVAPRAVDENGAPVFSQSEKNLGEMIRQGLPIPPGLSRTKEGAALIRGAVDYSSAAGNPDAAAEAMARGQNRANWVGAGSEQRAVGTATASNALYGNAAASTIDTALRASAAVPRSEWLPWNQVVQMGQKAMSDPKLAAFATATNTLINDYAKATTPVGVPTDGQRAHAESLLGTAQSPEVYDAVARMMHKEIANTHRAIQDTKTNLQGGHVGELPPLQMPPPGGVPAGPAHYNFDAQGNLVQ
jgi:hypothetical protein